MRLCAYTTGVVLVLALLSAVDAVQATTAQKPKAEGADAAGNAKVHAPAKGKGAANATASATAKDKPASAKSPEDLRKELEESMCSLHGVWIPVEDYEMFSTKAAAPAAAKRLLRELAATTAPPKPKAGASGKTYDQYVVNCNNVLPKGKKVAEKTLFCTGISNKKGSKNEPVTCATDAGLKAAVEREKKEDEEEMKKAFAKLKAAAAKGSGKQTAGAATTKNKT